jgi:hypothetical protein
MTPITYVIEAIVDGEERTFLANWHKGAFTLCLPVTGTMTRVISARPFFEVIDFGR